MHVHSLMALKKVIDLAAKTVTVIRGLTLVNFSIMSLHNNLIVTKIHLAITVPEKTETGAPTSGGTPRLRCMVALIQMAMVLRIK